MDAESLVDFDRQIKPPAADMIIPTYQMKLLKTHCRFWPEGFDEDEAAGENRPDTPAAVTGQSPIKTRPSIALLQVYLLYSGKQQVL